MNVLQKRRFSPTWKLILIIFPLDYENSGNFDPETIFIVQLLGQDKARSVPYEIAKMLTKY